MTTADTLPALDLTKQAPRSARLRVGGFVILARMADKGRAFLAGTAGEYHFACPLDQRLLEFKGVSEADVRMRLTAGDNDPQLAEWITNHGIHKTPAEIKEWSDAQEASSPMGSDKHDWFVGECQRVGLDPAKSTLFDFLDADDKASFQK